MMVRVPARTISSCLDSAAGEAVVVVRFLASEGEGLSVALGAVRN